MKILLFPLLLIFPSISLTLLFALFTFGFETWDGKFNWRIVVVFLISGWATGSIFRYYGVL